MVVKTKKMVVKCKKRKTFAIPFLYNLLPFLSPFIKTFDAYHVNYFTTIYYHKYFFYIVFFLFFMIISYVIKFITFYGNNLLPLMVILIIF